MTHPLILHWNILVHVLAAMEGIVEHIGNGEEINEVTRHIAHEVGEEVLHHGEHATAYHHHHEDSTGLSRVFAQSFGGKVKDGSPHHRGAETAKYQ